MATKVVSFADSLGLLGPYVKDKLIEQVKALTVIILYLVFFQTLVLGIPIAEAGVIASGLGLVVVGLAFFMEGLVLGLMPLGEVIGLQLPKKSRLPVILIFSFILGIGATYAEPAIGVLKAAGASVKAWEAPLLFMLLNKLSGTLVISVGVGVGMAVVFGMLRFLYGWSLKPFIYVLVGITCILTIYGYTDPNLRHLAGLAWDCGAVTTGPVTVPLVLALGLGVSRMVSSGGGGNSGFGVVTLASLFPILAVMILGLIFYKTVPNPADDVQFFAKANRAQVQELFAGERELESYVFANASAEAQLSFFGGDQAHASDAAKKHAPTTAGSGGAAAGINIFEILKSNTQLALQAIVPLVAFLLLTLVVVLREKLPDADLIGLGVGFAVVGMTIFGIGIELGLSKIGQQVGSKLPAAYTMIDLPAEAQTIHNFDPALVHEAIQLDGGKTRFFYRAQDREVSVRPYKPEAFDAATQTYKDIPNVGPLFGRAKAGDSSLLGIFIILLFAFFMGYGATLAEPALNALGAQVESITVGTFKKSLLMQAVALGVATGISIGVAKIVWDIPLVFLLIGPYCVLFFLTAISTEEFVNIGWDSAGVTTGPITVPLVLAMGLGIGGQSGVVEGFGILSMASVCPVLSVLTVGLFVTRRRKALAAAES